MKKNIKDPKVRESVYKAFKGQCFFTGRPIKKEDMVIDHLVPKNKGGSDSFDNFVLTFRDLNLGKSDKYVSKLESMRWIVEKVYAPRAREIYESLSKSTEITVNNDYEENRKITLRQFRTRIKPPQNLKKIQTQDLFWAGDKKIEIYSESSVISEKDTYELIRTLERFTEVALEYEDDYCFDVWLTKELKLQLKSLWYSVNSNFFKPIKSTKYYDNQPYDKWAYVYFTKYYLTFLSWRDEVNEFMEAIFDIEDDKEQKTQLRKFCSLFPPPESYASEILN